jgi:hypothetical protein
MRRKVVSVRFQSCPIRVMSKHNHIKGELKNFVGVAVQVLGFGGGDGGARLVFCVDWSVRVLEG